MTGRVVVVGLGPGDPGHLSAAAADAIRSVEVRFVRTARHPSASAAGAARSFDDLYEQAASVEEVYERIVAALEEAAKRHGTVLYALPGSPLVAERTVELLRLRAEVEVEIVASLSFLDLAWERLGIDPVREGVLLVDGHRFAEHAAGRPGPFLVSQCDTRAVLSEIKLALDEGPEVTVLQRLGLADESVTRVAWADLDREVRPDHLTCVWVPALTTPVAAEIVRLEELVRTLRSGCPWDREQTHRSLRRHLVEETYEVLDAIDTLEGEDGYGHLEEELGDLLFQIVFHSTLAAEAGEFELADVARGVHDKLVRRHPHVFGPPGTPVPDWEAGKRAEKGRRSVMDGVPPDLPALLYAVKVQSKAASVVEDPDPETEKAAAGALATPGGAGTDEWEIGEALFAVAGQARRAGVDPEAALRAAVKRFVAGFRSAEVSPPPARDVGRRPDAPA